MSNPKVFIPHIIPNFVAKDNNCQRAHKSSALGLAKRFKRKELFPFFCFIAGIRGGMSYLDSRKYYAR